MDKPYQIYDRFGVQVLQSTEKCRYSKETELGLLEHGYTIKLNGKKITKKELHKEKERKQPKNSAIDGPDKSQ